MGGLTDEQKLDLVVELATEGPGAQGLDEARRRELFGDPSVRALAEEYEYAAAALWMALSPPRAAAVPHGLEERILDRWRDDRASTSRPPAAARELQEPAVAPGPRPGLQPVAFAGWFVAAAALALCVVLAGRLARLSGGEAGTDPALARAQLLAEDPSTFELAWVDAIRHATSENMSGNVVWSDRRNEGYMTFTGLAENDPSVAQYQLWIFRGTDLGAEPHPVDGGVFDVPEDGEIVVPIDPKLELDEASSFVVTLERPGGVVVSDRSQIVAVAQRAR